MLRNVGKTLSRQFSANTSRPNVECIRVYRFDPINFISLLDRGKSDIFSRGYRGLLKSVTQMKDCRSMVNI
jgi:hypothetical protein